MKSLPWIAAALALSFSAAVLAQPSHHFKYKHKYNGTEVCDVAAPGPDWEEVSGPYQDANCTVLD